jgi:AmmeMemoRadiSam system protein B
MWAAWKTCCWRSLDVDGSLRTERSAGQRRAPKPCDHHLLFLLVSLLIALLPATEPATAAPVCPTGDANYPPFYRDAAPFEQAIASVAGYEPSNERLTGITVPHHLAADRLVALGFRAASQFQYKRVILLSPDHFFEAEKSFATTTRSFDTVLGPVRTDRAAVEELLGHHDFVEPSCLFAREHGVLALLPFLRRYFPAAAIVPVAISIKSGRADWDRMAAALQPLVDADTLIVQSTDFSHYLPQHVARGFDQQTLNILASGSLDMIAGLTQPGHADSSGALYIQTKLQQQIFRAAPLVVANENMQQYSETYVAETTSYMVVLFGQFGASYNNPATGKEHLYYFAGDTMFGRAMTRLLSDELAAERIVDEILARTRSRPLIVNLEGVVLPNVPEALEHMTLGMPEELALDWLKRLNVAGVSLANNHAFDLGGAGYRETVGALQKAGIPAFGQGEALQLPGLDIVGLTDIGANGTMALDLIVPELLDRLVRKDASKPVMAFVHWGSEYVPAPGPREKMLADEMRVRSVSAIVGAHPHVADGKLTALGGGDTLLAYSLGNFLFDQTAERSSGTLLEVRIFEQGTFFARLIPLPNFFDLRG